MISGDYQLLIFYIQKKLRDLISTYTSRASRRFLATLEKQVIHTEHYIFRREDLMSNLSQLTFFGKFSRTKYLSNYTLMKVDLKTAKWL